MRITYNNVTINYKDKYNDEKAYKKASREKKLFIFLCALSLIIYCIPYYGVSLVIKILIKNNIISFNNLYLYVGIIILIIAAHIPIISVIREIFKLKISDYFYKNLNPITILANKLLKIKHIKANISLYNNDKTIMINNQPIYKFLHMYNNIKIIDKTKNQIFNNYNIINDINVKTNNYIQVTINAYYSKAVIFINDLQ